MSSTRKLFVAFYFVAFAVVAAAGGAAASGKHVSVKADSPVNVQVFAPRPGDSAGKASKGFFVDLAVQYPSLASSGADFQLTGPATHQNQAPFPGAAAPGVDEKLPGLIVLLSTSTVGARNAQNLANLFNLTGFTNQRTNEIWDTWIVAAPLFGRNVGSVLRVAVAADKNKDGISTHGGARSTCSRRKRAAGVRATAPAPRTGRRSSSPRSRSRGMACVPPCSA